MPRPFLLISIALTVLGAIVGFIVMMRGRERERAQAEDAVNTEALVFASTGDPLLVRLKDRNPAVRAAALDSTTALTDVELAAVRALFEDPDPVVQDAATRAFQRALQARQTQAV
jgi:hypothetical protein